MNRFVLGPEHQLEAEGTSPDAWADHRAGPPSVRPTPNGAWATAAGRGIAVALLVGLLAGACSSSANATPTAAGGGGSSVAPTSGTPASAATAAPGGGSTADPCSLLTPAEVGAVLGVSIGPGQPSGSRGCTWLYPSSGVPSEQATITIDVGTAFSSLCGGTSNAAAGITITQLSGIGDGACYSSITGLGVSTNLTFEKGGQAYTAAVVLPVGSSDGAIEAANKTLALDALGKL